MVIIRPNLDFKLRKTECVANLPRLGAEDATANNNKS